MSSAKDQKAQADALDVLIEQERQLITHYDARQNRAESTAAAAITAVLALAALMATAAETNSGVDENGAWFVVGGLTSVCVVALFVRSFGGLRRTRESLLSHESDEFDIALKELRDCETTTPDPIDARRVTLKLCRARAEDAHKAAKDKDRWAAAASLALAISVGATGVSVLNLLG